MRECSTCKRCFQDDVTYCPNCGSVTLHSIDGVTILDGRYQVEERLGQGGMGVVFKGHHVFLKTTHAIKVILPDLVGHEPMLATRFRHEAMAAARLRHQNIISITDYGVLNGTMPFLVMEYIQGKSLHDILVTEGALPLARALEIMEPICAGVAAAHRRGIVHRDLKPRNIVIADGEPIREALKVLDFGLAKIKSGELLGAFVAAQSSGLMGSPHYMAPEQWCDEAPDSRADIYALGVILFQMLAGDVPFKGGSIPAIMKQHVTNSPPTFASVGVEIPPEIEAAVRQTLEKDPDKRPPSVEAFMTNLRDAVAIALPSLTVKPDAPIGPATKALEVFICYASEDKQIAEAICETLEARDIGCWIAPRDVLPGMSYAKAIIKALKASRVMVLLFSSQSNDSPHVRGEVERALSSGITIIPVRIEDVPLSDEMQYYVGNRQWYDALIPPLEKHLQPLALIVHQHLGMSAT
jgi:serine/threonine protein kinase